jgi:hypothetical protein
VSLFIYPGKLCCIPDQCMYPAHEDAETLILGLASFPADIDLLKKLNIPTKNSLSVNTLGRMV